MANIILKQPTLNDYNLSIRDLHDKIDDVIKKRDIKPAIKKYVDIYEQSTQASATSEQQQYYNVPEFNEQLIDNLTNEGNIIYNKRYKQETYLNNALFYILWNYKGWQVKIYAYGFKPSNYTYVEQLGNLYFVSNKWFILFKCEPFNITQFNKLVDVIYYDEDN